MPAPLLRLLDQVGEVHGLGRGQKRFAGELLVIPGAHQQYTVRGYNAADTGWIAKGYRALGQLGLEYLRETTGREASDQIVLLDSASGITPVSMPSLLAANVILVFFRMSIQHHQGTTGNLPDLFDYLDDKHGECRFEDESQRRRMQRQRVIAMATCVDSRTEDILGKLREAMPLSGAILESYTRIGDFWDYVKAESGLPVFGRAIQYGGEFAQHPILTCRETGVFFSSAYANDGEEDPVALHASQAHTEYVERCLEIATHLIKLGRS